MAKQRVLCLHGWRSNPEFMEMQIRALKEKLVDFEFVFLEGPVSGMLGADDVEKACLPPYFEWWEPLDGLTGQMDAVRYVAEYMRHHGPFEAMLGFAEGAACASLVMATLQGVGWQSESAKKLERDFANVQLPKLFISVSATCPEEQMPLLMGCFAHRWPQQERDFKPIHGIPSVHVIGERDPNRRTSEELMDKWFGWSASSQDSDITVLYHLNGHCFPCDVRSLAACMLYGLGGTGA